MLNNCFETLWETLSIEEGLSFITLRQKFSEFYFLSRTLLLLSSPNTSLFAIILFWRNFSLEIMRCEVLFFIYFRRQHRVEKNGVVFMNTGLKSVLASACFNLGHGLFLGLLVQTLSIKGVLNFIRTQ